MDLKENISAEDYIISFSIGNAGVGGDSPSNARDSGDNAAGGDGNGDGGTGGGCFVDSVISDP